MGTSASERLAMIAGASARDRVLIAARSDSEIGMDEAPDKIAALLDTVCVLDRLGILHALIGGVAVGIHSGVPRATLDVDVAIHSSAVRRDVIDEMAGAGFELSGEFSHRINFRHPSGEPVQFAIDPYFDASIERAEPMLVRRARIQVVRKREQFFCHGSRDSGALVDSGEEDLG